MDPLWSYQSLHATASATWVHILMLSDSVTGRNAATGTAPLAIAVSHNKGNESSWCTFLAEAFCKHLLNACLCCYNVMQLVQHNGALWKWVLNAKAPITDLSLWMVLLYSEEAEGIFPWPAGLQGLSLSCKMHTMPWLAKAGCVMSLFSPKMSSSSLPTAYEQIAGIHPFSRDSYLCKTHIAFSEITFKKWW